MLQSSPHQAGIFECIQSKLKFKIWSSKQTEARTDLGLTISHAAACIMFLSRANDCQHLTRAWSNDQWLVDSQKEMICWHFNRNSIDIDSLQYMDCLIISYSLLYHWYWSLGLPAHDAVFISLASLTGIFKSSVCNTFFKMQSLSLTSLAMFYLHSLTCK